MQEDKQKNQQNGLYSIVYKKKKAEKSRELGIFKLDNFKIEELSLLLRKNAAGEEADKGKMIELSKELDKSTFGYAKGKVKNILLSDVYGIEKGVKISAIKTVTENIILMSRYANRDNLARIFGRYPELLSLSAETKEEKIKWLADHGVNPGKAILKSPNILLLSVENMQEKANLLESQGIRNLKKVLEAAPTVLTRSSAYIEQKFKDLKDLGFEDPARLAESAPVIISISFSSIKEKIDYFKNFGISIEDIKKNPFYLVYSLEGRIKPRMEYVNDKTSGNIEEYGLSWETVLYTSQKKFVKRLEWHGIAASEEEFTQYVAKFKKSENMQ
ncbi:MAG: hypothetical protein ACP5LP_03745 [Candidatus Micrarchaeia archaeon]